MCPCQVLFNSPGVLVNISNHQISFNGYNNKEDVPAGSACSRGTAPLPVIRPTSLLLYRTESSVSTILDGSSCFMLFHQSAASSQRVVTRNPHETELISYPAEPWPTCTIPVRKIIHSFRTLLSIKKEIFKSWRATLLFFLQDSKYSWRRRTCSSSATHKPQSRWEQSEPWPTRAPELLPGPHLRAKPLQWTPDDQHHYKGWNEPYQKSDAPLPVWGGIVVFLISGVCVVWLSWGGRFLLTGGGVKREGDLGSGVHLTVENK